MVITYRNISISKELDCCSVVTDMNYSLRATYKIKQTGNKTGKHADLEFNNKEHSNYYCCNTLSRQSPGYDRIPLTRFAFRPTLPFRSQTLPESQHQASAENGNEEVATYAFKLHYLNVRGSFQKFCTLYVFSLKMNLFYKIHLQAFNVTSSVLYHSGPTFEQFLYSCLDAFVVDASDYSGQLIRHLLNASEAFPTE
jgi:hypothetical protein